MGNEVTRQEPGKRAKAASRGRPSQQRVAAIEENILSAARTIFLEHGFSGASMDNVAQLAEVSKSTLYARYPDKSALFEAVAKDRLKSWWIDMPRDVLPAHFSAGERLLRRGLGMLRMLRLPEVAAFNVLMASEVARFPHLAQAFRRDGYEPLIELIAADIKAAAEIGGWSANDPAGVAESFVATLHGWHMASDPNAPLTEDDCVAFVSRLVGIFLTGRAGW